MTPKPNGRPPVGPQVKIAFPPELVAAIDRAATERGMSRAAWVRNACEDRLNLRRHLFPRFERDAEGRTWLVPSERDL